MGKYSIKDLEKLSGIKAHTLRIWEQRYGILAPSRSSTNIRYYTDDELKKILKIGFLNHSGIKISKIALLSDHEITDKVLEVSSGDNAYNFHIDNLVIAMVEMDEQMFNDELSFCIKKIGFEETFIYVIHPFFTKVGILWLTGNINPVQEHLISNLIRQKLIVAIDNQKDNQNYKKKFILFLPENEWHELGLLFYSYLIKKNGYKSIYLGQSVPLNDLQKVFKIHNPEFLMTSLLSYHSEQSLLEFIDSFGKQFNSKSILLLGKYADEIVERSPSNIHFIDSIQNFKLFLQKME